MTLFFRIMASAMAGVCTGVYATHGQRGFLVAVLVALFLLATIPPK